MTAEFDEQMTMRKNADPACLEQEFYKICKVCGKRFSSRVDYKRETSVVKNNPEYPEGNMPDDEDPCYYFELRNCFCGATLCVRLASKRDLSTIGILRRKLFDEVAEFYAKKDGLTKKEAEKAVYKKYRAVFRAHLDKS